MILLLLATHYTTSLTAILRYVNNTMQYLTILSPTLSTPLHSFIQLLTLMYSKPDKVDFGSATLSMRILFRGTTSFCPPESLRAGR